MGDLAETLNAMPQASRRLFLAGAGASGLLVLAGCSSLGQFSYVEAIRRLLTLASQRAFATLVQPDGFWDSAVARVELPVLFGRTGSVASAILKSKAFREQLQHRLNRFAEDGARAAAPVVAESVRSLSITDAVGLVSGGKTAATTYLRQSMGPALVNAMIPQLSDAMRIANDPILGQAMKVLAGVDIADAAHALALNADNAIWFEIGAAEADIRANPQSTNDPLLIGVFKVL